MTRSGDEAETFVMPLAHTFWGQRTYTFCAVRIVSGKTHQIRRLDAACSLLDQAWWLLRMVVSINGGTPRRLVYNGKSSEHGWFGGTPILGNLHIFDMLTLEIQDKLCRKFFWRFSCFFFLKLVAQGKHLEYLGHPLVADRKYNPLGARDKEWCPRLPLGRRGAAWRSMVQPHCAIDLACYISCRKMMTGHMWTIGRSRSCPWFKPHFFDLAFLVVFLFLAELRFLHAYEVWINETGAVIPVGHPSHLVVQVVAQGTEHRFVAPLAAWKTWPCHDQ